MSSNMYKSLLALLAATASAMPTATSMMHDSSSTAGATPTVSGLSMFPSDSFTTGPVVPLDTATAVPSIVADMKKAATNVGRFKALLAPEGKLLEGEELRQRTVFDFNQLNSPAPNATGKFPLLTLLG
jgi:hypothetical protein